MFFRGGTRGSVMSLYANKKTTNRSRRNSGIVNMVLISFYCLVQTNNSLLCSGLAGDSSLYFHLLCTALFVLHVIQNADSICAFPLCDSHCETVLILFGFDVLNTNISCFWHCSLKLNTFIPVCQLLCHCLCSCEFMLITTVGIADKCPLDRDKQDFYLKMLN